MRSALFLASWFIACPPKWLPQHYIASGKNWQEPAARASFAGEDRMAQVIIRRSTIDLGGLPRSVRADHARFLGQWRDALVTYGLLFRGDAPAGYLYQTDLPGNLPEAAARFMAEDPLAVHGVVESDEAGDWHCALATR